MKLRLFTSRRPPPSVAAAPRRGRRRRMSARVRIVGRRRRRHRLPRRSICRVRRRVCFPAATRSCRQGGPGTPSADADRHGLLSTRAAGSTGCADCLNYNVRLHARWTDRRRDAAESRGERRLSRAVGRRSATCRQVSPCVCTAQSRQRPVHAGRGAAEQRLVHLRRHDERLDRCGPAGAPAGAEQDSVSGRPATRRSRPAGYADTSLRLGPRSRAPRRRRTARAGSSTGRGGVSFPTGHVDVQGERSQQSGASGTARPRGRHVEGDGLRHGVELDNARRSDCSALRAGPAPLPARTRHELRTGAALTITHAVTICRLLACQRERASLRAVLAPSDSRDGVGRLGEHDRDDARRTTARRRSRIRRRPRPRTSRRSSRRRTRRGRTTRRRCSRATYSESDADSGTLSFQLCSDAACSTRAPVEYDLDASRAARTGRGRRPRARGRHVLLAGPGDRLDRRNVSGWSATRSFVVDTVAARRADVSARRPHAARVNSSALNATFVDSDATDSGTRRLPALHDCVVLERRREHDVGDRRRRHRRQLDAGGSPTGRTTGASARPTSPGTRPAGPRRRASYSTRTRRDSDSVRPGERRVPRRGAGARRQLLELRRRRQRHDQRPALLRQRVLVGRRERLLGERDPERRQRHAGRRASPTASTTGACRRRTPPGTRRRGRATAELHARHDAADRADGRRDRGAHQRRADVLGDVRRSAARRRRLADVRPVPERRLLVDPRQQLPERDRERRQRELDARRAHRRDVLLARHRDRLREQLLVGDRQLRRRHRRARASRRSPRPPPARGRTRRSSARRSSTRTRPTAAPSPSSSAATPRARPCSRAAPRPP